MSRGMTNGTTTKTPQQHVAAGAAEHSSMDLSLDTGHAVSTAGIAGFETRNVTTGALVSLHS